MSSSKAKQFSRREIIAAGATAGFALTLPGARTAWAQRTDPEPVLKAIPSSGEKIAVIGLGTNAYGVTDPVEIDARKQVLERMSPLGGQVIDTARGYGRSEEVIGELLESLKNRQEYFIATKTPMGGSLDNPKAVVDESFKRLRTDRIELMQIHNLFGWKELLPTFREYQQAGKIRYIGITTSQDAQYEGMLEIMRAEKLDFIQVDYSLGNRGSEEKVLPLAQERGIAVLANMPLGGRRGSLISQVGDRKIPEWAAYELGVTSWAQLLLKYVVSHPAVTCAIPGTTKVKHVEDNQFAGRGKLPNAAQRKRIEELWQS
jgi:aryl-alcohol dehydrogenase-like predicted oxidoreductase